ncbi:hypothetical protein GYA93_12660 [Gordonia desulfuricans]|uniref:Uncharacterized protein n=1 Tax=Gordonia desulfuricans TaxID=89051 RepID=A0A7K3LQA8_9ACTN|nr:hypothetical protein [Gordonia desulfuricans]NDK90423.1 hypothetical protein [Gordonia desulfuricans]
MTGATLQDAVDLIPEAWHDDIANDAESQGCDLSYAVSSSGLRTETVTRIRRHFAAREADADWQALSAGQQLDECFPSYGGIGWPELLDELGITTVYVTQAP